MRGSPSTAVAQLEQWLAKNSTWVALAIIAGALVLRFVYADLCYLNPDEASHFGAARPTTWIDTYKAAFLLWHPPLFILVLHGFQFLGRSEVVLRAPSLIAGTVALWLTFSWIRRCLGETPALIGLGFIALSSAAISASTEVRQYGLLLCFISGALYATERSFAQDSVAWTVIQGLFLACATLTHYTATIVLVSVGSYVLIRSLISPPPPRVVVAFCLSSLVLATLVSWLYFGHIRGELTFGQGNVVDYLQHYYFQKSLETPAGFVWRAVSGTFVYAVGMRKLAMLVMIAVPGGILGTLAGRTQAHRLLAVLIISPFVVGFVCAIFQIFPFAGTRHQIYLLPFIAAGISAAVACVPRRFAVLFFLAEMIIAPYWIARARPDNDPRVMPRHDMTSAIDFVRKTVAPGTALFVDEGTLEVLKYYLGRNDRSLDKVSGSFVPEQAVGGYRVGVATKQTFLFQSYDTLDQVSISAHGMGVPAGDPLWIVSVAWLQSSLVSRLPAEGACETNEFGRISVIEVLSQRH